MSRFLARTLVAAAATVTAVAGMAAPAAAEHPARSQPFAADSGDNCRYGTTAGTLPWAAIPHPPPLAHSMELPSVAVSGTLSDRPLPADPGPFCPDDGRHTIAHFQAFTGNVPVDSESPQVNNDRLDFEFLLAPSSAPVDRIDRVVVTVCREPLFVPGIGYCGKPRTYTPPNVTNGGSD